MINAFIMIFHLHLLLVRAPREINHRLVVAKGQRHRNDFNIAGANIL